MGWRQTSWSSWRLVRRGVRFFVRLYSGGGGWLADCPGGLYRLVQRKFPLYTRAAAAAAVDVYNYQSCAGRTDRDDTQNTRRDARITIMSRLSDFFWLKSSQPSCQGSLGRTKGKKKKKNKKKKKREKAKVFYFDILLFLFIAISLLISGRN